VRDRNQSFLIAIFVAITIFAIALWGMSIWLIAVGHPVEGFLYLAVSGCVYGLVLAFVSKSSALETGSTDVQPGVQPSVPRS